MAPMRTCNPLWLVLSLVADANGADDDVRLPVQVDQKGTRVNFVVRQDSDVTLEALRFCKEHLVTVDRNECISNLVKQVSSVRDLRQDAMYPCWSSNLGLLAVPRPC